MKILICTEFFYPHIGGVEKHSQVLANYFVNKNHQVHIATTFIKNRNKLKNLNIKQFKIKGNIVKGFSGDILKYQNFLINNKYDLIFFNAAQQWSFDLALPIIDKILSRKILFPCGFSRLKNILYAPYFSYLKKKVSFFDSIICSHKKALDYKFFKKITSKKVDIIHNGSEVVKSSYSKNMLYKKYKINKSYKIICNISNIKYLKGQDRCINIFDKIKTNNTVLFLIGNNMNPIYTKLINYLVKKFNHKNKIRNKKIILLHTTYIEARTILNYSDLFLFTSRVEYDPLVIYESIISKTKFVSYGVGLVKYHDEKNGFVSNNINHLINKTDELLLNKDKQLLDNNNQFLWSTILAKYEKIFLKI